jgi:16S rRNA (cytidine1402-2'-O)-methyltransferase
MQISLIPTPIGNLEDITLRALRLLREADLIAAEDTRTSGNLLKHFDIDTPRTALHQHNEHSRIGSLLDEVEQKDMHLAVVTDAGTPSISDPGFLLVREAIARGIPVQTLPGATAFVPALVNSGLPCDRFLFEGFLPQKKGRKSRIEALAEEARTIVFYESPHRVGKALKQFVEVFGEHRQACVCREISKLHEETVRGSLGDLATRYDGKKVKGEIVIVVAGR